MEKNQNERKWLGILIWVVFAFITFAISYKIYNDVQSRGKKEIEKPVEKHEVEGPVPPQMDSTYTDLVEGIYPITVSQVTKSTYEGYKWEVVAENGIMFYTNNKPKIGDVVFYMDETTDKVYYINK
jgi:hypothetical protein